MAWVGLDGENKGFAKRRGSVIRSPFSSKQMPQLSLLYRAALSAFPLRNISLTVATK
jgi:hypothetical protein